MFYFAVPKKDTEDAKGDEDDDDDYVPLTQPPGIHTQNMFTFPGLCWTLY